MEAINKLIAEAMTEEKKLILGWMMDFNKLIILLPDNKYQAWRNSIQDLLVRGSAREKELEMLIGRLGHLDMIIPIVYHFLTA